MGSSLPQNRGAIRRVVVLAAVIVAIVLAGALALLFYAASSVDRVQVAQERALVAAHFARNGREIVSDLRSVAIWDEAYLRLSPAFDDEWADVNIGAYYPGYLGHHISLVLDGDDAPVYAWRGEARIAPASAAAFLADAAPLIARLRRDEAARGPRGSRRNFAGFLAHSGVMRSQGAYYLVGVANVVPETPDVALRPDRDYLIVSAKRLDSAFLRDLQADLLVAGARLAPAQTQGRAIHRLIDVNDRPVGALAWTPKRPGVEVLRRAVPLFVTVIGVLLAAGLGLALWVRAVFRKLAAGDEALQSAMDELVAARDEADAANLAKSQFLANMSHEIRTPLNGVLGMTQVLAREDLTPGQRRQLDVVRDSGQTLLTVLNDILDISKIEAGRLEIDAHEFDLAAAVHAACIPFASLADQKDVAFRIEIEEAAHGVWFGDAARLRQVLGNLASNAVKFTDHGEVAVDVVREAGGVRFTVSDTGIGIPAERLGELFEKFSQVDASTTRKFGGTGLGLAISRELAALMGGELSVDSTEGAGSAFTLRLPLEWRGAALTAPLPPPVVQTQASESGAQVRILAAEDNPTNQLVLAAMLEPFGVALTLAANGREAVEAYLETPFDLILMDVQMPVMNGVEATGAIRRLEAERALAPTPILALSANVMTHQVAEYLAAGMNGFVPKPIETARLLAAIDAALGEAPDAAHLAA